MNCVQCISSQSFPNLVSPGGWIDAGCLRYGFSVVDFPNRWSSKSFKDEEVKFNDMLL